MNKLTGLVLTLVAVLSFVGCAADEAPTEEKSSATSHFSMPDVSKLGEGSALGDGLPLGEDLQLGDGETPELPDLGGLQGAGDPLKELKKKFGDDDDA